MVDLSGYKTFVKSEGGKAIPTNMYKAEVSAIELKENSKKTGKILKFSFKVLEGDYKNSVVNDFLNVENTNSVAVDIAFSKLRTIVVDCFKMPATFNYNKPESLLKKTLMLDVELIPKLEKPITNSDKYDQNKVVGYIPLVTTVKPPVQTVLKKAEPKEEPKIEPELVEGSDSEELDDPWGFEDDPE